MEIVKKEKQREKQNVLVTTQNALEMAKNVRLEESESLLISTQNNAIKTVKLKLIIIKTASVGYIVIKMKQLLIR